MILKIINSENILGKVDIRLKILMMNFEMKMVGFCLDLLVKGLMIMVLIKKLRKIVVNVRVL